MAFKASPMNVLGTTAAVEEPNVINSKSADPHLDVDNKSALEQEREGSLTTGDDPHLQFGVRRVKALTQVWPFKALIASYIIIWIIYFVLFMQSSSLNVLTAFITSQFGYHSLTPTITIVASVVSGVITVSIAKLIDVFGRPHGLAFGIVFNMLGMIIMATARNIESTAAATVFWQVGYNALFYTITIFVADTSSLKNRALMLGLVSSPNMIVVWIAGYFNESIINGPGWQWAFGIFAMVGPVVSLPIFAIVWYYTRQGAKALNLPSRQSFGSPAQTLLHYLREFDVVGLLLFSIGLSLFLLSFNLASLQTDTWRAPMIIAFIVIGGITVIGAIVWEIKGAGVTFLPYGLLRNRTVAGSTIVSAVLFFSYYCWASYFSSFLLVVNNLSVQDTTYVSNINGFGGAVFNILIGWYISRSGKFKAITLFFAIPLCALGIGLMAYFIHPEQSIGYLVMCQIFISCGSTIVTQTTTLSTMAAVPHQELAIAIALISICSSIGGAVGSTVASTIWQNVFPKKLAEYLPAEELPNLLLIYSDIETQLSYPVGSATRLAIQQAYGAAQRNMLIAGATVWSLAAVGVFLWKNIDVKETEQVSGQVA